MSKLLYANFFKLLKNKLFWIGIGFMFFAGGFLCFQEYRQLAEYDIPVSLESTFFVYTVMIGVISAIFCSLFISVEYNDGTVRNKIIAGYKRSAIYFSNLIVTVIASFLFCGSYILANVVIGIPLIGSLHMPFTKVILILAGSFLTVVAFCAIFTMISMLITSKAVAPVVCVVMMFLSIAYLNEVQRVLDNPKIWYDGTINTAYVGGAERARLEFISKALPVGQEMQYSRRNIDHIGEMSLYSAGIIIITTGVGIIFFQKKNIK